MVSHEVPPGDSKLTRSAWFDTATLRCSPASRAVFTHTMIRPRGRPGVHSVPTRIFRLPGSIVLGAGLLVCLRQNPVLGRNVVDRAHPRGTKSNGCGTEAEGPSPEGDGFGRHKHAQSAEADFRSRPDRRLSAAVLRRFRSLRDLLKASPKGEGFHPSPMGTLKRRSEWVAGPAC